MFSYSTCIVYTDRPTDQTTDRPNYRPTKLPTDRPNYRRPTKLPTDQTTDRPNYRPTKTYMYFILKRISLMFRPVVMSVFLSLIPVGDHLGFGLMNAEQMVSRALSWTPVATQISCATKTIYTIQ